MDYHKNAPWTAISRERLARLVINDSVTVKTLPRPGSASARKRQAKWVARYRQFGAAGLADRSSRPHCSPRQISSFLVEKVLALRRGHMPGYEIARRTRPESGFGQPHPAPCPAEPMARLESTAAHTALRASTTGRPAAHGYQGHDALRRGLSARRWTAARQEGTSRLPGTACGRRRPLAHGLHPDAARSEGRNHHRLSLNSSRRVLRHPRHRHTRPADRQRLQLSLQHSSVMLASRWPSNIPAPDPTHPEPTARPSASSRPRYANGPTQNTGLTPSKEMLTCSLGSTITTVKDLMVASTTSRPSAAPISEQRLDHLQAPGLCVAEDPIVVDPTHPNGADEWGTRRTIHYHEQPSGKRKVSSLLAVA